MPSEIPIIASVLSTAAAWIALFLSLFNVLTSRRALQLAERQEGRRQPILIPYLVEGYVRSRRTEKHRVYAFLLSVSNPSDTDNGISDIDLRVTYTTTKGIQTTVKVREQSGLGNGLVTDSTRVLHLPARVEAHGTISGWALFRIDDAITAAAEIDGYLIVLTDSQGVHFNLEPIMVRELIDETETP